MPTYDYVCNRCNNIMELFHGMNETPEVKCSECASEDTFKKISGGVGIHFKGSGFYVTDYKNKKESDSPTTKEAPKKEKKEKDKPSKTSENKSKTTV